ncbi:hypothetical protein EVAR_17960_1 [Eumeta japonica]|uniref:Uncharacterized protein n=1 Tax=Eumeta variegata TaxID=151549 RepID=A0A4C1UYZ2_EUMVA|nr:hypothetical protein EVAR_17960_1 [Eumeta japonica]
MITSDNIINNETDAPATGSSTSAACGREAGLRRGRVPPRAPPSRVHPPRPEFVNKRRNCRVGFREEAPRVPIEN